MRKVPRKLRRALASSLASLRPLAVVLVHLLRLPLDWRSLLRLVKKTFLAETRKAPWVAAVFLDKPSRERQAEIQERLIMVARSHCPLSHASAVLIIAALEKEWNFIIHHRSQVMGIYRRLWNGLDREGRSILRCMIYRKIPPTVSDAQIVAGLTDILRPMARLEKEVLGTPPAVRQELVNQVWRFPRHGRSHHQRKTRTVVRVRLAGRHRRSHTSKNGRNPP